MVIGVFADEADILPTKCGRRFVRLRVGQDPASTVSPKKGPEKNLTIKVWGALSSIGVGPLVRYKGTIKAENYLHILQTHLLQAFPFLENQRARNGD